MVFMFVIVAVSREDIKRNRLLMEKIKGVMASDVRR